MKKPEFLKPQDLVAIICPASYAFASVEPAINLLKSWGLRVWVGETVEAKHHQFAGTDELRVKDFQSALDNPEIKAVFAARGGYGTVRIIDKIDFSNWLENPKWIIGFSDITVLHSHISANHDICTIHGQMPLTMPEGTPPSLETLRKILFNDGEVSYQYTSQQSSLDGKAEGHLIGGNLALLASMIGSKSEMDYNGKILFLEDIGEAYYNVDRMLWTLSRAGNLENLKGLIVGGFTSMKDSDPSFGMDVREIILEKIAHLKIPVAFDFPAGHIENNHALIFGEKVQLQVENNQVNLQYL